MIEALEPAGSDVSGQERIEALMDNNREILALI